MVLYYGFILWFYIVVLYYGFILWFYIMILYYGFILLIVIIRNNGLFLFILSFISCIISGYLDAKYIDLYEKVYTYFIS
jgi:hypothetical protein